MAWLKSVLKILEIGWKIYATYKQKSHERAVKKIKDDPSGAWAARFGRVQPDSREVPSPSNPKPPPDK